MIYRALAIAVLVVHLAFILWVIFGALLTRGRPLLRAVHIASLIWGLLIEALPWTCPLTFAENWLELRAGVMPYRGGFLLHYLDAIVYPNLPPELLTLAAVAVVGANFAVYRARWMQGRTQKAEDKGTSA